MTNSVSDDPRVSDKEWAAREGMVAFAGYPLIAEDRLVGVLGIFTHEELPEATIATLAAVADWVAGGIQGKWAEAILRESEARFRQLAENNSEALWMTDAAKKVIAAARKAA